MNGKLKVVLIALAVLIISGIVSFVSVIALTGKSDKIFPGVVFKGIHLGNKTRTEARTTLDDYVNSLKNKPIAVKFEGGSGKFKIADISLQVNTGSILDKVWSVGRQGNLLEQWQERKNVVRTGREVVVEFSFDKNKLNSILSDMTKEFLLAPQDAKIFVTPSDTVQIVESSEGRGVDLEKAFGQVKKIINEDSTPEIVLDTINMKPAQTTQDLENLRVTGEIASFTTSFDINKTNRVYNIKVAAEALDGQMIKPGQSFSFNEVVGPRSQEAGYKLAPTILNNEFIDSLGGGVCQVSTTLYNVLLQADVEILQRSNHSLTIRYVPLGQDAAVAFGGKDLRFKNTLPFAIIMKAVVSGNRVTLKLFGDVSLKKTIHIISNVIKEYPFQIVYKDDPTLKQGVQLIDQHGTKGYRVVSRKLIYQNSQLIGEKPMFASYYAPLNEIVLVGTKPVTGKPESTSQPPSEQPPAQPPAVPQTQPSTPPGEDPAANLDMPITDTPSESSSEPQPPLADAGQ